MVLPQTAFAGAPATLAANGEGMSFGNMAASGLAGRAVAATGGGSARALGIGGGTFGRAATTATIIVINSDDANE